MPCASALSTASSSETATADVLNRVAEGLQGQTADLAVVFASIHHAEVLGDLAETLRRRGLARHVLGCTGESVIGDGLEIEAAPGLSLWAIALPSAVVRPLRLSVGREGIEGWPEDLDASATPGRTLLLLADPFRFPIEEFLKRTNADRPGLRVIGGMASASHSPGRNRLVLDEEIYRDGAVGIFLEGPVTIRTVVSQGCRPVGRPMIVTKVQSNIIRELGRRPAVAVLQEQFAALPPDEQERMKHGLHIGRVINEYQESFHRGDFLVRNVLGADEDGGIAIGDMVRVGQTVQFHVRDAETADEDLRTLLRAERPQGRVAGALLFSCNGRGTRLFPEPNHDVGVLRETFGPIPVAGFFAMGEIGPVGGQSFLHSFTASLVLFGEPTPARG
jgi:small ligand-binding sensory domain FIST